MKFLESEQVREGAEVMLTVNSALTRLGHQRC